MLTKKCPKCGNLIVLTDNNQYCPSCGRTFTDSNVPVVPEEPDDIAELRSRLSRLERENETLRADFDRLSQNYFALRSELLKLKEKPANVRTGETAVKTLLTFYPLPEGFSLRGTDKPKPSPAEDFEISGTVLVKYKGKGGDVVIPDSVTSIGKEAFYGCKSLKSVTIPDSVTSIGDWAFNKCESLTSVTIPDSVMNIGTGAFVFCESLTSVTIPDSVMNIGTGAFAGCKALTSVTIPDSVTSIDEDAFCGCESLTSVTIPDSVTSIGREAFYGCKSLKSVTIPDSVTIIGYGAFMYCESLTSVTIPDSVTSIDENAFWGCEKLTLRVTANSKGERYAKANKIKYKLIK